MADVFKIMSKLASNPELVAKIKATKKPEEIVAIAKQNGVELSLDEVKKALSEQDKYKAFLSKLKL